MLLGIRFGRSLGKISILTNLDWSAEKVYFVYKEREEVELAFDAMKNELENDKAYLGNDDAVKKSQEIAAKKLASMQGGLSGLLGGGQ